MSKLPQVSGKNCLKALSKVGFFVKRQKGSHIIVCRNDPFAEVVIPNHKTLDKGTLRAIIRQADLDVDEFIELLND
jgi:predicted RNA binding protein YcfA (HicA-like mRNA interferase family)